MYIKTNTGVIMCCGYLEQRILSRRIRLWMVRAMLKKEWGDKGEGEVVGLFVQKKIKKFV